MIKIPCGEKHYWMDGILHQNLKSAKYLIKKDWDFLYVIDGKVGTGKSVFAQQVGWFLSDTPLTLDNIAFSGKQFLEALNNAQKNSAVIFDESFRGLSSRNFQSEINNLIIEKLNEIRQKNLFILIVQPSMWDIEKHVTQHRCSGLFHVYYVKKYNEKMGFYDRERGHVKFYTGDTITYFRGNSNYKYIYPKKHAFKITFRNFYPIDEEAYRRKKLEALHSEGGSAKKSCGECKKKKDRLSIFARVFMKETGYSQTKTAEKTGFSRDFLRKLTRRTADSILYNPQDVGDGDPLGGEA